MGERGPATSYVAEMADFILEQLCDGLTLRAVCRLDGTPDESTVRKWALDDVEGFAARYSRAREIGYHCMADEVLEIADDGRNDWMERDGRTVPDHEHISRSRLRFDARRWLLSKALPKIYGDKVALTGADGGAVQTVSRIERVFLDPVTPPPY